MIALKMIGDPDGRLPSCVSFIQGIDWTDLRRAGHGYSHGYDRFGAPLAGNWYGFGMETVGLNLCALIGGAPAGEMGPPPSDNGSGFILHAHYPLVPRALDAFGNDWTALRLAEAADQLAWYSNFDHSNPPLVAAKLIGLSPADRPDMATFPDPDQYYRGCLGGPFGAYNNGAAGRCSALQRHDRRHHAAGLD